MNSTTARATRCSADADNLLTVDPALIGLGKWPPAGKLGGFVEDP